MHWEKHKNAAEARHLQIKSRDLRHIPFWSGLETNSCARQRGAAQRTCINSKKSRLCRICSEGNGGWIHQADFSVLQTRRPEHRSSTERTVGLLWFQAQCLLRGKCYLQKLTSTMTDTRTREQRHSHWICHKRNETHCLDLGSVRGQVIQWRAQTGRLVQAPLAQVSSTSVILWKSTTGRM